MSSARAKLLKDKLIAQTGDDLGPKIEIDDEDERAFDEGMAEAREGKTIPLEAFRAILQRL